MKDYSKSINKLTRKMTDNKVKYIEKILTYHGVDIHDMEQLKERVVSVLYNNYLFSNERTKEQEILIDNEVRIIVWRDPITLEGNKPLFVNQTYEYIK